MRFVIVGSPRTGSTHLTTLLNGQSDVLCNGEILNARANKMFVRWPNEIENAEIAELLERRERDPRAFLELAYNKNFGRTHVGFKIFSGHNDAILGELLAQESVKKVVLFRSNVLAAYSSTRIAHKFGQRVRKTARDRQPAVKFGADKFLAYCDHYLAFYRFVIEQLNFTRQVFFTMHYEQLNDPWFFGNLLNFIGSQSPIPTSLTGRSVKQNSSDILKRFTNPEEALKCLKEWGLMAWAYESNISLGSFQKNVDSPTNRNCSSNGEGPEDGALLSG